MSNRTFKGWLVANGHKQKELAELLGISIPMLSMKLNDKSQFSLKQVKTICEHYGVSAEMFLQ